MKGEGRGGKGEFTLDSNNTQRTADEHKTMYRR